jgi:hypothetical protein
MSLHRLKTSNLVLCFIDRCDGMTLPSLPLDVPVPPAVLARRRAVCVLRTPDNNRRPMQVRNLQRFQCPGLTAARRGGGGPARVGTQYLPQD